MNIISTNTLYLAFLGKALEYAPSARAQCICCVDAADGKPIAGVIYDAYNGQVIMAHIWVDAERKPSKEWFAAIFDYPFNKLQVEKIIGQVRSSNGEALKLDYHFGFSYECRIKEFYPEGDDLIVLTMTREQCLVLNSPVWAKTVDRVARI